jgi:hypothetical protein
VTFVFGSLLFLLGAFFGMLIMAFATALPRQIQQQQDQLVSQLRLVTDDKGKK